MTRGIQQSCDMWEKFMETHMFNFRQTPILRDDKGNFIKNPDGTYKKGPDAYTRVQGALRPIKLYEYVFPQESLQEVLAMMQCNKAFPLRKEITAPAWLLRRMMGAKPIPKEVINAIKDKEPWQITQKYVPMNGMAVYPVGIREDLTHDYIFKDPATGAEIGLNQEGL